jgi:hypothetical protein
VKQVSPLSPWLSAAIIRASVALFQEPAPRHRQWRPLAPRQTLGRDIGGGHPRRRLRSPFGASVRDSPACGNASVPVSPSRHTRAYARLPSPSLPPPHRRPSPGPAPRSPFTAPRRPPSGRASGVESRTAGVKHGADTATSDRPYRGSAPPVPPTRQRSFPYELPSPARRTATVVAH